MSIFDWSTTAGSNGNSDATINFQEGQAPSTVNDSARALMARVAFWRNWFGANMTQGGSSNAYTITSGESLSAYSAGMRFLWSPNADSTGAVTLNVDSIGAKKVYMPDGTQAASGDLDADSLYDVVYQTALDSSSGGFKIAGFQDTTLTSGDYLTKANNLSDLQSASTARTNLALGSAATSNLGTIGATVPLLNNANTWGDTQEIAADGNPPANGSTTLRLDGNFGGGIAFEDGTKQGTIYVADSGDTLVFDIGTTTGAAAAGKLRLTAASVLSVGGNTVWHAGNDGAGSGLDADTLDGDEGSLFAKLAGAQTFTGKKTFTVGVQVDGTNVSEAPLTVLHPGNISYGSAIFLKTDGGTDDPILSFENYNSGSPVRIGIAATTGGGLSFRPGAYPLAAGSEVASLDSSGEFYGADFNVTSDARLKSDIASLEHGPAVVAALRPVRFNWKDSGKGDLGFVAQEVRGVIPEAVKTHTDGYLRLTPDKVIPYLVLAVQELQAEIATLKGGDS